MASKRALNRKDREKSCLSKKAYKTEAEAWEDVHTLVRKNVHQRFGTCWLQAYPCRFCPDWHIGHVKPGSGNKVRRP